MTVSIQPDTASQVTISHTAEAPSAIPNLQAVMDATLLQNLQPVSLGLGLLLPLIAISHQFLLPPAAANLMSAVDGMLALLALLLTLLLKRQKIPSDLAHPVGALLGTLLLISSFLQLNLTANPWQTTNFLLIIIGAGLMLLSTQWLMLLYFIALGSWGIASWLTPHTGTWAYFGFALAFATVLSMTAHLGRVHSIQRVERLRISDANRQAELKEALNIAQATRRALETTIDVGQRLTSILDLDILLHEIVELIRSHYGYYYVGVFLMDNDGQRVVARAGTGEAGRSLCASEFSLGVGAEGIIGWVAQHREPALVNDVSKNKHYLQVDVIPDTQAELALPLETGGELLGVLDLQSTERGCFSNEDLAVFRALAAQVAVAIRNAAAYESERTRRVLAEKLNDIGRALSQTLDLQHLLELILEHLRELVPYDRGSVMLRSGEELEIVAARGFPTNTNLRLIRVGIDDENDLFWQIYNSQKPLLIPNVAQWPSWVYVEDLPKARSWIGVPLIRNNEVIGMVSLVRETTIPYTQEEATLASTFASQAAIAIQNAQLYENATLAYAQLERLDRTKSDFLQVAGHELRTPLTIMKGYSQILQRDPEIQKNPMHQQMVAGIFEGTVRLHAIVNSMLDMVKIDSQALQLHMEPVCINEIVAQIAINYEDNLQERALTFNVQLPLLPQIEADEVELHKVLDQLVVNAIKYTPDGGTITLTGRGLASGSSRLSTSGVEIVVSDTGIGVDPQNHKSIFTKFQQIGDIAHHSSGRTKFMGGGPGLGLAIAKGIVEAHGGHLWIESPGYDEDSCPGSSFHILLPLHPPKRKK